MNQPPPTDACEVLERGGELRPSEGEPMEVPAVPEAAQQQLEQRPGVPMTSELRLVDTVMTDPLPEDVEPFTDLANAHRIAREHGTDLRHCPKLGGWLVWSGARWERDYSAARRRAMDSARRMVRYAGYLLSRATSKEAQEFAEHHLAHARRSQSDSALRSALSTAQDLEQIAVKEAIFDQHHHLLAARNCTVDLRTGETRPHQREDYITRLAGVAYDPHAPCPTWEQSLELVLPDPEVRGFAKRYAGYSATGSVEEQCLTVNYGDGDNGKSTAIEAIKRALGEYATEAPSGTFVNDPKGRSAENKLAGLRGARMVTSSESGEGKRLEETLVKRMTGGDELTANHLYKETFNYHAQFSVWLITNHLPDVRGVDRGIWRRLRLVPWTVTIPREQRDPAFPGRLRAETEGILRWIVEGAIEWHAGGLQPPEAVLVSTREWQGEANDVARFVDERCVVNDYAQVKSGRLYAAFRGWAAEQGVDQPNARAFGMRLKQLGYKPDKTNASGRIWRGVGLPAEEHDA